MGKSSPSASRTEHQSLDGLEHGKKATHSNDRKCYAPSYGTKNYSDPEMISSTENRPSEISQELKQNDHSGTGGRRSPRVECIAFEADGAELQAKLLELEASYSIPETEPALPIANTAPEIIAPALRLVLPTKSPKIAEKPVEKQLYDICNSAKEIKEKQDEIANEVQPIRPSIPLPNKQVQALKQFLGEYNKNNEPLSSSEMDNLHDNDISTAFVDASGGTRVKQQLQHEPAAETIDMLIEHASDMRASIRVGSLELPLDILQKEKMLFAAGAGISVATGAWILETRPGVLSSALSNITRMLG